MARKALIVGGNSGIGLAAALHLLREGALRVTIVGNRNVRESDIPEDLRALFGARTHFILADLTREDYSFCDTCEDIDTLIITAGFGRVAPLQDLTATEINNLIRCNELAIVRVIHRFYDRIRGTDRFDCAVMVSIAGHIVSPLFSVYSAAKAGLAAFIASVNAELYAQGCPNRILDCSPGALKGTAFHGGGNDMSLVEPMAAEIIARMTRRETLFIPDYDSVYRGVTERSRANPLEFGKSSWEYKEKNGRLVPTEPQQSVVGYLSGTFDLFHVGHLNLLRRAGEQCNYLIVGVHDSGSWKGKQTFIPLEERKAIVGSVRYVDRVVDAPVEDSDAWELYHYSKLFVGSDYKGTERFRRYEAFFADKGVEIVYFPYTQGTSSTQLRAALQVNEQKVAPSAEK